MKLLISSVMFPVVTFELGIPAIPINQGIRQ